MTELVRAGVLRAIDICFPNDPVVLTLGGTAREMLAVAGRRPNHLINLDAMGQTISLGLGLALGLARHSVKHPVIERPESERVIVVEGDGSLLMGLSVLATVGHLKPHGFVVFVLDNGVYLATGGQPTVSAGVDLVAAALACGWAGGRDVRTAEELTMALEWSTSAPGPILVRVHVTTSQPRTDYLLDDPVILAEDFRRWLRVSGVSTASE